jgi:hypothetical protein
MGWDVLTALGVSSLVVSLVGEFTFFKSGELLNLRRVRRGLKGKAWVGFACRAGTAGVENARAIVRRPCDLKSIMRISLDRRLV